MLVIFQKLVKFNFSKGLISDMLIISSTVRMH